MFKVLYKHPVNLVMAANIAAYAVLFLFRQPFDRNALLICLLVSGVVCIIYYVVTGLKLGDEYLFLIVSMLFTLGLAMIYRLDPQLGQRQLIWFAVGLTLFFTSYLLFSKIKIWSRLGLFYAAGTFLLNIITLVFGRKINGSTSWIVIQGHSFQLSEISKILFILFLACFFKDGESGMIEIPGLKLIMGHLRKDGNEKTQIRPKASGVRGLRAFITRETQNRALLMAVTFINAFLMILQREWGTVALFFILYITILYVFGKSRLFLLCNMACTVPVALFGYFFINHIKVRVDIWLNPWSDPSGKGYQMLQSLFAIGSGGFLGTGLGSGRPDLIPAVNTDFIFPAICEELGIMCGIAVILLYFILFYRGVKIALNQSERFYRALSLGISVMFGIQTFIIIGGVIKLIPLTGITLPFVSYGGSSLVSSFISLGILQAVHPSPRVISSPGIEEAAENG